MPFSARQPLIFVNSSGHFWQIYAQRASQKGVSADQIGRAYAQQILAKAPRGTKFLQEDGSWITR